MYQLARWKLLTKKNTIIVLSLINAMRGMMVVFASIAFLYQATLLVGVFPDRVCRLSREVK